MAFPSSSVPQLKAQRAFYGALLVALLALAAALVLSVLLGAGSVGPGRALPVLLGGGDAEARFTVLELRLPRTLIGAGVGVALGIAGLVLQAAARNPLAEPGLLGVSAGAAFAVVTAVALGASAVTLHVAVSIFGALIGCFVALAAARLGGLGTDPVRIVLAGAALSSLLWALISLQLMLNQRVADDIRFWTVGAIGGRSLEAALPALPALGVGLVIALLATPGLAALSLGEQVASSLGHRPRLVRMAALIAVALLVGGATAVAGPVGFVGLVVPFAARAVAGPDLRRSWPLCVLLGPAFVIVADVLSRLIVRPAELPLGVITACAGAPVLVAIVRARRLPTL